MSAKRTSIARQLPKHVQLSDEEMAVVARLIRVIRVKRCWLGHFIQCLLQRDAEATDELSIEEVKKILTKMENLNSWVDWMPKLMAEFPHITGHPGVVVRMESQRNVVPFEEEDEFYELERQWRLEHPAPQKRQTQPSGRLGMEDEDD